MMRSHGTIVAGIAIALIASSTDFAEGQVGRTKPTTRQAPAQKAAAATLTGDDATIAAEFDRLVATDKAVAAEAAKQLLLKGKPDQRPLAMALFLRAAEPKAIAALAKELRNDQFPVERRFLVRSLGRVNTEEALPLIEPFVNDMNPLVRAAAASALADHGRPMAVGLFMQRMPSLTDYWDVSGTGDEGVFGAAVIGACRELTGETPETHGGFRAWWEKNKKDLTPASSRPAPVVDTARPSRPLRVSTPTSVPKDGELLSDEFDFRFQPKTLDEAVARQFNITGAEGWATFSKDLDSMAASARKAAAPLFAGELHLPLTRVDFANSQTFGGVYGVANRGGVASRCRLAFNIDEIRTLDAWRAVVRHEFIHVIQMSQFAQMPRWLAEGVAESLTESHEKTVWSAGRIERSKIAAMIDKGGVSEAISWQTGGVTGNAEPPKYAISHLVVDYLRFGPISEPETRLYCLMGELNRGTPAKGAVERIYGKSLKDLDRDFATWVKALPAN